MSLELRKGDGISAVLRRNEEGLSLLDRALAHAPATTAEKAWIIDPYQNDPEKYFKWVADPDLKEASIQPRPRHAWRMRTFEAARDLLGLDREQLREARWELSYRHLRLYRTFYNKGVEYTDDELINEASPGLAECIADNAPFAGMARYFVRYKWKIELA